MARKDTVRVGDVSTGNSRHTALITMKRDTHKVQYT